MSQPFQKRRGSVYQVKKNEENCQKKDSLILQAFKQFLNDNEEGLKLISLIDLSSFDTSQKEYLQRLSEGVNHLIPVKLQRSNKYIEKTFSNAGNYQNSKGLKKNASMVDFIINKKEVQNEEKKFEFSKEPLFPEFDEKWILNEIKEHKIKTKSNSNTTINELKHLQMKNMENIKNIDNILVIVEVSGNILGIYSPYGTTKMPSLGKGIIFSINSKKKLYSGVLNFNYLDENVLKFEIQGGISIQFEYRQGILVNSKSIQEKKFKNFAFYQVKFL